ncbi:cell wall hydrolase [Polycladomyces subterraneus]|uniref:Cell wall hydrolase n=1 Tax=Polycladomyces subterraneus TaxID=1016997 RepID=A0ABT8IIL0_9BACL|nr:cell wall hydrolase [Polycladomyces subterraneus]MDN4592614.1 cell wall hydrolase [Polycladomyces subterraneus]
MPIIRTFIGMSACLLTLVAVGWHQPSFNNPTQDRGVSQQAIQMKFNSYRVMQQPRISAKISDKTKQTTHATHAATTKTTAAKTKETKTKKTTVTLSSRSTSSKRAVRYHLSAQDIRWMERVVYSEARGEPFQGQVAVAAVLLNRLESPHFPSTIRGIIFQRNAFTAVQDGQIWLKPDNEARLAVMKALKGYDPTGGALYYYNPEIATAAWSKKRPVIKRIGNHVFTR